MASLLPVAAGYGSEIYPLTMLKANITPRSSVALNEAAQVNGESRTNVINRAIQIYALLTRMMRAGWEVVLRNPENGYERRVRFR
jgi:hypothetical protein